MIPKQIFKGGRFALVAALLLAGIQAQGHVRLPKVFSDNMVLQQGMHVPIWGWADEGEVVTVTFRGQTVQATAKDGKWMVKLAKLKAGGPDDLTVEGSNQIVFKNVLVGEVWLASGQSNMEFPLRLSYESQADINSAANPMIRLLHVSKMRLFEPTNNIHDTWKECTPDTVAKISAVGYYFVRDLQKDRGVPIGLIESDWGGTAAEVWVRESYLASNSRLKRELIDPYPAIEKQHEADVAAYLLEKKEADAAGKNFTKRPPLDPWRAGELYNGMIAPLIPYGIAGVIWYQGESNAGHAEQYRTLFPDLIRNWRHDWDEGNFPFLLVQLAPFMAIKDEPGESAWAELREAQLYSTQVLPKVGMAVITDVGNPTNIHPTVKKPAGERLARAARAIAYHEKIEYSGPIYRSMKVVDDKAIVSFDHAESGLEARDGELKGFAICGRDHKFVWAKAQIDGEKVIVTSPTVINPVAVRYGWADCPVVNLWNKAGLPASPFRTDDFPMITAPKAK